MGVLLKTCILSKLMMQLTRNVALLFVATLYTQHGFRVVAKARVLLNPNPNYEQY